MRIRKRNPRAKACLLFTLCAAALFAQYAYILSVDEFYPSISLPRGTGMVEDGVLFSRSRWLLFAVSRDGARIKVDEHSLLAALPSQYRSPVIANGFGLTGNTRATAAEMAETRDWLRQRVENQIARRDLVGLEMVLGRYTPSDRGRRAYVAADLKRIDF